MKKIYANQKVVNIKKQAPKKGEKNNPYAIVNVAAVKAAMHILGKNEFHLYMYLILNQPDYSLALSPAAVRDSIGMSRTSCHDALKGLEKAGYIKKCGEQYVFFDVPFGEITSLRHHLELSKELRAKKSAACSDREKAKREKAAAASLEEPEPDLETGTDSSCTENPIHDELDAESSECENPIRSAPEADTGSAKDEVHTIPETGYRNIKNNIYNKINNIRDYDVERSETSPYPSTGNKFDAVLDGFLSDTGSASFIDTPKKRTAPSSHCRGTNSFAKSEFGFNGEPPF